MFSVDGASSAEYCADLISQHQSLGNDTSEGDGAGSHPESEQVTEDDIHMEDDEESLEDDSGSEEWDRSKLPRAP